MIGERTEQSPEDFAEDSKGSDIEAGFGVVGNVADDGFCNFVAICAAEWLHECFCESNRGTLRIVL